MEQYYETKTYQVAMRCDKCREIGEMVYQGSTSLLTSPPKYVHKCNYCDHEENYPRIYPYLKTERVY